MNSTHQICTIGHSDLELDTFLEHLRRNGVTAVADVRSQPHSRRQPQFNRLGLQEALRQRRLSYAWLGTELGARREEPECYIAGRADYDRIAMAPAFLVGLRRLHEGLAKGHLIALLCAERDPLDCHRTILVCRHLTATAIPIAHILYDGSIESHAAAESRLLSLEKESAPHLFATRTQRLDEAYRRRGEAIAFVEATEDER